MKRPLETLTHDEIKQAWLYAEWIGRMRKLYQSSMDPATRASCADEAALALTALIKLGQEDIAIDMHENEVDREVTRG